MSTDGNRGGRDRVQVGLAWADPDNRSHWARLARGAWLLFVVFPLIGFLQNDPGTAAAALCIAAVVVFGAIVLIYQDRGGGVALDLRATVGLAALVTAMTLAFGSQFGFLYVWVSAGAGRRLGPPKDLMSILALSILAFGATLGAHGDIGAAIAYGTTTLGIGFLMTIIGRLATANDELLAAREERARLAVAEERLRFSRDLHDLVGHSLSLIALKAQLAGRVLPEDPERAAQDIAELQEVAREALVEVRQAVSGYRRPTLEGELAGARMALEAAGIEMSVQAPAESLPEEVDEVLAWTVREGTTNVIRHSNAGRAQIRVLPGETSATVEVRDDGRTAAPPNGGHGLEGLRERAERLSGRVEAGSLPEGGFRLAVSVPVPPEPVAA